MVLIGSLQQSRRGTGFAVRNQPDDLKQPPLAPRGFCFSVRSPRLQSLDINLIRRKTRGNDEHRYSVCFQDDDVIGDLSRSMHVAQSAQSMLLTADQNSIMRLPNFSCFMHHQVKSCML